MPQQSRHLIAVLAAFLSFAIAFSATALEPYPAKPVRLIVPYGAGGPNDTLGRYLARQLGAVWGQPMVVENRPGAGANIGMVAVAKSPPDGYTLMIAGSFAITVNPSLYRSMPLNPAVDLAPIVRFASAPLVMVVAPESPANSVAEFVALAKNAPGRLNGCSLGPGTGPAVGLELFKQLAGIATVDINYRAVPQCNGRTASSASTRSRPACAPR
jgi:tripartite-type tricarboxylate transporter receptor subunit TctC